MRPLFSLPFAAAMGLVFYLLSPEILKAQEGGASAEKEAKPREESSGAQSGPEAKKPDKHPNVVLVMTDDQGYGDIRLHGNSIVQTPALDGLAKDGVRLDRFYVSPVCAPTRASLLTGRYHLRTGVHGVTRARETMREEEVTLAEIFKAAGYATGCFGKWHNGAHYPQHPNGQGFDEFFGFCAGHWNNYFDTELERNGVFEETRGYLADLVTDEAIEFIKNHKDGPFFCYVPLNPPHSPWQAPELYWERYKDIEGLSPETACAYAMCHNIDANVSRLLRTLATLKLDQDTIFIFTTDNGPNGDRFNADMKGHKGSVNEGGVRVPFFIRWPGRLPEGKVVETITSHIDVLPTLVELTGVPMPESKPLDGMSFAPLLKGDVPKDWPDRFIFSNWAQRRNGSVRSQRFRFVYPDKLYDMEKDPGQTTDIAAKEVDMLFRMKRAYDAWYEDVTADGFEPVPVEIRRGPHPEIRLPGHEALLYPGQGQGIDYRGQQGWANDWVDHWTSLNAYPYWQVRIAEAGTYRVLVDYICPATDTGATVQAMIGSVRTVPGTVMEAYDPPRFPSPDLAERKEVHEMLWETLDLGTVELETTEHPLEVRLMAQDKPGAEVLQVKTVRFVPETVKAPEPPAEETPADSGAAPESSDKAEGTVPDIVTE